MSERSFKALALVVAFVVLSSASAYAAQPVVVVVKVVPSVGREDELQAQYLKRIEFLRKAEPNATFRLHRSTKSPTTFLWYEVYESQQAYDNHIKVVMPDYRREFGPTPDGVIAKPSESETYVELAR